MGRMPVPDRIAALSPKGCPPREPWRIIRRFHRLSARRGLVAYALRTRAPLSGHPKVSFPFDLHVLGLPLAFILSQDQTLRCNIVVLKFILNLGFRLDAPHGLSRRVTFPRGTSRRPRSFSCAGLRLSKNLSLPESPLCFPLVPSESGCKSTPFFRTGKQFFHLFFIFITYR